MSILDPELVFVQRPGETIEAAYARGSETLLAFSMEEPIILMAEPADTAVLASILDELAAMPEDVVAAVEEKELWCMSPVAELRTMLMEEPRLTLEASDGSPKPAIDILEAIRRRARLWLKPSLTVAEMAEAFAIPLDEFIAQSVADGDLFEHPGYWDDAMGQFVPWFEPRYVVNPAGLLAGVVEDEA